MYIMVSCLRTKKENTQEAVKFLKDNTWFDENYKIGHSGKYVLIPVIDSAKNQKITTQFKGTIEDRNLVKIVKKSKSLKDAIGNIIPTNQIDKINRGFEVIGDIALIEIPDEVEKLEKNIAWALKRLHKKVNVVVKKGKRVSGKYRLRKNLVLAGENRTETLHVESGVKIKVDINKSYFSSKMGSERLRISSQVKPKENILVMFSGVGPSGLVIAKKHPQTTITLVEMNPSAHKYAKENVELNKLEKRIKLIKGDAKVEVPKLKQKFNRIIMVLPEKAHEFLSEALQVAKKCAIIHMYQFENETRTNERSNELKQLIEKTRKVASIKAVKAGAYGPKINRYCFDIKLKD
jgi:tRNA (guanine37-N1)-methyltransferase